jgi:hypothetical protein
MQTSLRGIANKAAQDKSYRFQNLVGLLTSGYLLWCWQLINKKAAAGVEGLPKATVCDWEGKAQLSMRRTWKSTSKILWKA